MKIQDIRIGSRIRGYYDEGNERKYRDFKVKNILGSLEEVESEEGEIFHIDDCDGIPLTEEILKAKGFTIRSKYYSFRELNNIVISFYYSKTLQITDYDKCVEIFHLIKEDWKLHELQNALWDAKLYDIADNTKLPE